MRFENKNVSFYFEKRFNLFVVVGLAGGQNERSCNSKITKTHSGIFVTHYTI
jgi:hypothetical protein